MKKVQMLVLMLVFLLSLSMVTLAADKTRIESKWDDFFGNAAVSEKDYKITASTSVELLNNETQFSNDYTQWQNSISVLYALNDYDISAQYSRISTKWDNEDTDKINSININVKNKIYEKDSLSVELKRYISLMSFESFSPEQRFPEYANFRSVGLWLYVSQNFADNLSVYRNSNIDLLGDFFQGNYGIKYEVTDKDVVQAKLYVLFDDDFYKQLSLMYKRNVNKNITYLLDTSVGKDAYPPEPFIWRVANTIEANLFPSLRITGEVSLARKNTYQWDAEGYVTWLTKECVLGLDQTLGKIADLGVMYSFNLLPNFEYEDKKSNLQGTLEFHIIKNLDLALTSKYGVINGSSMTKSSSLVNQISLSYYF